MAGLVGIAAGIAAYDLLAVRKGWETISSGFRRCYRHQKGRLAVGAALGVLAAHLFENG